MQGKVWMFFAFLVKELVVIKSLETAPFHYSKLSLKFWRFNQWNDGFLKFPEESVLPMKECIIFFVHLK